MKVIKKFIKLSNSQYLKIGFYYNKQRNAWYTGICIANTKRQCNDCFTKTIYSPKSLYGKMTGKNIGLEGLLIAKKELLEFEKTISNTKIIIEPSTDRLIKSYRYLERLGYTYDNEYRIYYKDIV